MDLKQALIERADSQCELCSATGELSIYLVPPKVEENIDKSILICDCCDRQVKTGASLDPHHWRILAQAIWSPYLPVKMVTYRLLKRLNEYDWANDLLDQLYLEREEKVWADAVFSEAKNSTTRDSNGTTLSDGDSVTLIKDLDVKGANFTAKRGAMVKGISLTDDPKFVEGKVKGIRIVLVAEFLKKA